jgi:hypothetical protein
MMVLKIFFNFAIKSKVMTSQVISYPFSNVQLELLKIYTRNISEQDLIALKDTLAQFFAKKAIESANKAWDEKGLTAEAILNSHFRTPYPKH